MFLEYIYRLQNNDDVLYETLIISIGFLNEKGP